VYLRFRPPEKTETHKLFPPQGQTLEVKVSWTSLVRCLKDRVVDEFKFTKILTGISSQEQIYFSCVYDMMNEFINGNSSLPF
jgi:hypothetical protein